MLFSLIYENGKELTNNALRNELIFAFKNDKTEVEFNNATYHIEKMKAERAGYKQLLIRKD